ncbi:MAG: hypothetical protein KAR62_08520 [Sphingomonadales bacterium]|nr:hypothetical protein [Sphingomonadales bacterium]
MADISLAGSSVPQPQASSAVIRPPERVESERRENIDSNIERSETERSENALQNKSEQQAYVQDRRDQRSDTVEATGHNVDVFA